MTRRKKSNLVPYTNCIAISIQPMLLKSPNVKMSFITGGCDPVMKRFLQAAVASTNTIDRFKPSRWTRRPSENNSHSPPYQGPLPPFSQSEPCWRSDSQMLSLYGKVMSVSSQFTVRIRCRWCAGTTAFRISSSPRLTSKAGMPCGHSSGHRTVISHLLTQGEALEDSSNDHYGALV